MKDKKEEHDLLRKQLWVDVFKFTASASNCTKVESATKWADEALKQFDQRFKELTDEKI